MAKRRYLDEPENPPKKGDISLNEYLAQRAAEEQKQYYLEGSRNRDKSYKLIMPLSEDKEKRLKDRISFNREYINNEIKELSNESGLDYSYLKNIISNNKSPVEFADSKYFQNRLQSINDAKSDIENDESRINAGIDFAANCIATATSNNPNPGHYVTGNETFRANPGKYGWKEVHKDEIKPGGLIQMTTYGTPDHAVILDSKEGDIRYVNYSPGIYPEYKKHVSDWADPKTEYFYNFVGNHADTLRWTDEYNRGLRKYGGDSTRRSLKHGGIYIKPSHRGRFTALKERTGHSTTWFKENGTPAQKKMATFALNAAKWNH